MSRVLKKRNRRRDYQSKNFSNPFFKDKKYRKGRQKLSKKSILYTIIIILLLAFAFWFFYISDTFKIKNIEINGLERTAEQEILAKISESTRETKLFLKQDNLFLISSTNLASSIREDYNFDQVDINKELPGKLVVNISERKYEAIFLEDGSYYYIDKEAYIVDKINDLKDVNPRKYAIINNESNNKINNDKIGIESEYIIFIDKFYNNLKQSSDDIVIEKFIIKNINSGLSAQVINGPVLYLNIDNKASSQVRNLMALKESNLSEDFFKRSYIDLRYGDRLFLD
ncbi:MAG: cell division protein FtsQ/DivIB [Parcubacteria group bacterium]